MGDTNSGVTLTAISSFLLILAICLVLIRSRTLELRLILIGVFMAIAASSQGNVAGVAVAGGQVAVTGGLAAIPLMKIATILILSGVALVFMSRTNPAIVTPDKGGISHEV